MTKQRDDSAKEFRAFVRGKAGLRCAWDSASEEMCAWYRMLAVRSEAAKGGAKNG